MIKHYVSIIEEYQKVRQLKEKLWGIIKTNDYLKICNKCYYIFNKYYLLFIICPMIHKYIFTIYKYTNKAISLS
jgi:hypothetical protein